MPGSDGEWASSLGRFGLDDRVAFRHVVALSAALERGRWSHQARVNWRSGYQDMVQTEAGCAVTSADGLSCIRQLIAGAPTHLRPGGWLLMEHGWQQAPAVRELLSAAGFIDVASWQDLAGHERVTGGRWR